MASHYDKMDDVHKPVQTPLLLHSKHRILMNMTLQTILAINLIIQYTGVTYNGVPNVVYFYELSPSSNTLLNPKSAIFIFPL